MFEEIQKHLSPEYKDVQTDMETFKQWTDRKINTYTCLKRFRRHNKIGGDVYIDVEIFALWLNSIGWRRENI